MERVAVFGLGIAGASVARALAGRGITTTLGDDRHLPAHVDLAAEVRSELVDMDRDGAIERLLDGVDTLVPAPGVPPRHPVVRAALGLGIAVRTEIDIAYEWESARPGGARPILGVTGTDGKTTTTMLTGALLRGAGFAAVEVGNTDVPFLAALDEPVDAFVVECSSFRLAYTTMFRCESSAWLNFAPDHLDWHGTLDDYASAKARLWAHARPGDAAVVPAGDDLIVRAARASRARTVTFGGTDGDYRVAGDELIGPNGSIAAVSSLGRSMPHDVANALAAVALVESSGLVGAGAESTRDTLTRFRPPHHRIELVGEFGGSRWFDDSKATSPHAALTAIRAFDRLVLIAGGRNKDLDLSQMASEPGRMAGVVAIGEHGDLVAAAFAGVCPVVRAGSMVDAVAAAAAMAGPGIDVLLSPGCTSYDWYSNYGERGDDFVAKVRDHFGALANRGEHR